MLSLRLSLLRLGGKTYGGCLPDASQMPPRCLQMPPDASRCPQMPPDASRCLQIPQDASRCLQMFPDASRCLPDAYRCLQMPPYLQMPPDAARCFQMLPDASQMLTDTQTSSHRVNSAGDHKKKVFGVARRSHTRKIDDSDPCRDSGPAAGLGRGADPAHSTWGQIRFPP